MKKPILLLTRPKQRAISFMHGLRVDLLNNARVIVSPLLEISATGADPALESDASVIFTSTYAVGFAQSGEGRPAYCVGEITKAAAIARGWDVKQVNATAEDLIADMNLSQIKGPLVHLAGRHVRGDIAQTLTKMGTYARLVTLYDQDLIPLSAEAQDALSGEDPVIVPLFSPRTASHFIDQASDMSQVHFVAMSPSVVEALGDATGKSLVVAQTPTAQEMRCCVEKLLSKGALA
jgi:uroporphyrinogen-III synthase